MGGVFINEKVFANGIATFRNNIPNRSQFIQQIFRHGERSVIYSYPTDPHGAYKWPDGKGQLLQVRLHPK